MRSVCFRLSLIGTLAFFDLAGISSASSSFDDRIKAARAKGVSKEQVLAAVRQYHQNGPPIQETIERILAAERQLGRTVTAELWTADPSPNAQQRYDRQPWSEWYVVYSYTIDDHMEVAQWIVNPRLNADPAKPDADWFEYSIEVFNEGQGGSRNASAVERVAKRIADHGKDWLTRNVTVPRYEAGDLRNAASAQAQAVSRTLMEAAMKQVMDRKGADTYFRTTLPKRLRGKPIQRSTWNPINDFKRDKEVEVHYQVPSGDWRDITGPSMMPPATPVDGKPGCWLVTVFWTVDGRRTDATWISNPELGIIDPANEEAKGIDAELREGK